MRDKGNTEQAGVGSPERDKGPSGTGSQWMQHAHLVLGVDHKALLLEETLHRVPMAVDRRHDQRSLPLRSSAAGGALSGGSGACTGDGCGAQ